MDIVRAKKLKVKQIVHCPADMGHPAYAGKVEGVGTIVSKTLKGTEYVWVTVRGALLHAEVWPSNRLG
jgi:hypothetical protein